MSRVIKFRAWQDNQMLTSPISSNYGLARFFGLLYEDAPVMQFTGLQDVNGKDIWEGDYVLVKDCRISEVIFHQEAGCWDLRLRNSLSSLPIGAVSPSSWKFHAEVVGNIYQDPELLEQS